MTNWRTSLFGTLSVGCGALATMETPYKALFAAGFAFFGAIAHYFAADSKPQ